ncbi:MAG: hypothetical protein FJZ38_25045 [Candidatus Rokubacteria bacterium]|nr:hypothetical protein [Candidatus Rokubacteria bacterium]
MRWTPWLAALALLPLAAGCAGPMSGGALAPSATTTTTVIGWERWLAVDWAAQGGAVGQDLDGYVRSLHGSPIVNVRLLAQALDGNGNVLGQRIEWVPGVVPGLQRAYFRIPNMPAAERYRITVWEFETVEAGQGFL